MQYSKITVKIKDSNKPSYFLGSQLRGAFGYALKSTVCINPSFECKGCFGASDCIYFDFYEQKDRYHEYRFDYLLGQKDYSFSLYLFENAVVKLPYIVSALHKMLTQTGLGKSKAVFNEFLVQINEKIVYQNGTFELPKQSVQTFCCDKWCRNIALKLHTPLRMKKGGDYLKPHQLQLQDILRSIYKRSAMLQSGEWASLDEEIEFQVQQQDIFYKRIDRYSNRKKQKMQMDGLMGEIVIKNLDKRGYELLKLGEIVGVGKNTVFGLGKIEVKDEDE